MTKLNIVTQDDERLVAAIKKVKARLGPKGDITAKEFSMADFSIELCDPSNHNCGTAHCIGGWADLELGGNGNFDPSHSLDLSSDVVTKVRLLFYPETNWAYGANKKQARDAIKNFLDGKKNSWRGVKLD